MIKLILGMFLGIIFTGVMVLVGLSTINSPVKEYRASVLSPKVKFNDKAIQNGCFIAAIGYKEAFTAQARIDKYNPKISKLIYIDLETKSTEGHAIYVFEYAGEYRVYDVRKGTYSIGAFKQPPSLEEISKLIHIDDNQSITSVDWLK